MDLEEIRSSTPFFFFALSLRPIAYDRSSFAKKVLYLLP